MDFDEDMSGLQIEDLGEYFLQTDINDNWKGFSLGYTDDEQQLEPTGGGHDSENVSSYATATAGNAMQHLTSPSLSIISDVFKTDTGHEFGPGFDFPQKDVATLFQTGLTPASDKPDVAMMNRTTRGTIELENFSLDQHKQPVASAMPPLAVVKVPTSVGGSIKPAVPKLPSPQCQNIMISDNNDMNTFGGTDSFKRVCSTIGSKSTVSAISPTLESERGFRKKSREKLRRQEVNVKFEELIDLLGLSNRVRKSAVLHEAVSTITMLKRERDELRRDRDRLQQEVSKLATCLQYSHLGSVAAANAVTMIQQPNQQFLYRTMSEQHLNQQHDRHAASGSSGLEAVHTHPLNVSCSPGTNCFPLSSAFSNVSSQLGSQSSSVSCQVAIAPKSLKPAPSFSSYTPSATTPR